MSVDACAELVSKGDPDRFAATMTAPPALRAKLLPLYAFNLEVARAPWVTQEPMIAEMRLQWWADAVEEIFTDAMVRRHEVVTPLAEVIVAAQLPRAPFDALIEARRRHDAQGQAFADDARLLDYLDATSGGLMALAVAAAGADDGVQGCARLFGQGSGAANMLAAMPVLLAEGRYEFHAKPEAIAELLVHNGRKALHAARKDAAQVPRDFAPVMLSGWQADYVLKRARDFEAVKMGQLLPSEFRRRASLNWRALTGRW